MIGERLTDLRKDNGLTQEQLGKALNLTKSNISAYEREHNEAPDDTKIALAKYFNVSVDYLLGLTDQPNAYEPPRNCIFLSKDFPPAAKAILQCLARMMTAAYHTNPKAAMAEIERVAQAFTAISQEENKKESPEPSCKNIGD